jgi:hypothetical protein
MITQNFQYGDAERLKATLDQIRRTAATHRRHANLEVRGQAGEVLGAVEELTETGATLTTESIAARLGWKGPTGIARVAVLIQELRGRGIPVGAILRKGSDR